MRAEEPGQSSPETLTEAEVVTRSEEVLADQLLQHESGDVALELVRVSVGESGWGHAHHRQTWQEIPVFEGATITHFRPDGTLANVTDAFVKDIDLVAEPLLTETDAIQLAMLDDGGWGTYTAEPSTELMVFARGRTPTLAWRVELQVSSEEREALPLYFIDAYTGEILLSYDNLHSGTGSGHQYSNVSFSTYSYAGNYYLQDNTRNICTTNMANTNNQYFNMVDGNDVWGTGTTQKSGVDVHWSLAQAYDYFLNIHGWDGWDGAGGVQSHSGVGGHTCILAGVSWIITTRAAFDPANMALKFGDGGQQGYQPWTYIDIVGHEWMHAITYQLIELTNYGESGALSESISDVFGEMIEDYPSGMDNDWLISDGLDSGEPLRSMLAPEDLLDPGHHTERYTGLDDNNGIHTNAGIPNRVFTLLAEGGTHSNGGTAVTGIGKEDARDIWWLALQEYMTSGTTFAGMRVATLGAAAELFGPNSTEVATVNTAWSRAGIVDEPGDIITIAGTGTSGSTGDGGPATSAKLNRAHGVSFDLEGNLFIADTYNHKVRRVTLDGTISTFAGTGTSGYSGDSGAATSAQLSYPSSVVSGRDGNVYISDKLNHRIRKVNSSGTISTIVGTGTAGYTGEGTGTSVRVSAPSQVFLYQHVYTEDNEEVTDYYLYFADTDNHRVRRLDIQSGSTNLVAGTGTAGFSGDGGIPTNAQLDSPTGVIHTGSEVYIADSDNHRIRKVVLTGAGQISTIAGTGTAGNTGDGGAASAAKLSYPQHMAWFEYDYRDGCDDHLIFIADVGNDRVRVVDLDTGEINAFAGTGTAGYSGDNGPAVSATLDYPVGVGVDLIGNVYVSDELNHAVRKVFKQEGTPCD